MGTQEPGRISRIYTGPVNVLGHYRSGPYHYMIADPYRQDRRIAANGNMTADRGRLPFGGITPGRTPFGKKIVDEHDAMPYKAMIAYINQLANKSMGLYLAVTSDRHLFLYFSKRTDKGIIANGTTV